MPGSLEGDLFVCLFGEEIIQEKGAAVGVEGQVP